MSGGCDIRRPRGQCLYPTVRPNGVEPGFASTRVVRTSFTFPGCTTEKVSGGGTTIDSDPAQRVCHRGSWVRWSARSMNEGEEGSSEAAAPSFNSGDSCKGWCDLRLSPPVYDWSRILSSEGSAAPYGRVGKPLP